MIKKISLIFIYLLCPILTLKAEPFLLSFDDLIAASEEVPSSLNAFNHQSVQIKGFLYRLFQEDFVLAAQPNLKSCCVGHGPKLTQQIFVRGQLGQITQQRAVTLEGIFKVDPQYDKDGHLIQLYVLEQAQVVVQEVSLFPWKTIGGISLLLGILSLILLRIKRIKSVSIIK